MIKHFRTNKSHKQISKQLVLLICLIGSAFSVAADQIIGSNQLLNSSSIPPQQVVQPLIFQAPWPAGNEWTISTGSTMHFGLDEYAVDFNGPGGCDSDLGEIVLSVADGIVVYANWPEDDDPGICSFEDGLGCQVIIGHPDGFTTRYAHLREVLITEEDVLGDLLPQGTPIGTVGKSGGQNCAHLHFALYHCDVNNLISDPFQPCSGTLQGVSPQIWDGNTAQAIDAGIVNQDTQIDSRNFPVGVGRIQETNNVAALTYHQSIRDAYRYLLGRNWVFGNPTTPVESISGRNVQLFAPQDTPNLPWSGMASALIEHEGKAYLILGEIWQEYQHDLSGNGLLGDPVTNTYEWTLPGGVAYRSDFTNGSLVWGSTNVEYVLEEDGQWTANFFDRPNQFFGESIQRRDKYLNFYFPSSSNPGPIKSPSGFSVIWETIESGFLRPYKILVPEVQGYVEIFVDGTSVLKIDSPDQIVRGEESEWLVGVGDVKVEVRYWQDAGKPSRIWVTSRGVIPLVFAAGEEIDSGFPEPPDIDFSYYKPPSSPGLSPPSQPIVSSPSSSATSATMLVMDVSGSMAENWQGGIKIESAKTAANQVVNMLQQESQAGSIGHRVGLATFTSYANLPLGLSVDYDQARATVTQLIPLDGTNLGAGLIEANNALAQASAGESKIIILLSDGLTNEGLPPNGILSGPVQDAVAAGTCIYTVGFGDRGHLDEDLLRRIADASGCGEYYYAALGTNLESVYIRVRHVSTGNMLAEFTGTVAQGQTVEAGTFDVPTGQGELAVTLHWPGSALDLQLKDPRGRAVDENYRGATIETHENLVYALIQGPLSGTWEASVFGREVPQGTTNFDAMISARAGAAVAPGSSSGAGIAVLLLALVGGGVAVFTLAQRRKGSKRGRTATKPEAATASLAVTAGPFAGLNQPITSKDLLIGRGTGCDLRLRDPSVSRQHARIRFADKAWFIQDLGSAGGTSVNGQGIQASRLAPGDQIQIGNSTIVFRT